jgi:hypothetical protein
MAPKIAPPTSFWEFRLHIVKSGLGNICSMSDKRETVLAVHGNADGYWYIGAGRSIAEGPYRNPDQLLTVASDLLAAEPHWRIDVFDLAGNKIISYSSEELHADDLHPLRRHHDWGALGRVPSH